MKRIALVAALLALALTACGQKLLKLLLLLLLLLLQPHLLQPPLQRLHQHLSLHLLLPTKRSKATVVQTMKSRREPAFCFCSCLVAGFSRSRARRTRLPASRRPPSFLHTWPHH